MDTVQSRYPFKLLILSLIATGLLFTSSCNAPRSASEVGSYAKMITDKGGRLDWYKGEKHNLVAFDAVVDDDTKNTEMYTMQPDGSGRSCVTCNAPVPKGFVGQPVWHPDGEHIIFQAENENSPHTFFNHLAWGINNDLWIIKRDGSGAELIYKTKLNHAALHPQISPDGKTIVFSARTPTGRVNPKWKDLTPGGENHWEGWSIVSGELDLTKQGTEKISGLKTLIADNSGFFETHQILEDGSIIFSRTESGAPYVDDIYLMNAAGGNIRKLVDSPKTWDEHGLFSPDRKFLAFISSRHDKSWQAPGSRAADLETELYIERHADGALRRVTDFNGGRRRYLASDFSWSRDGSAIMIQAAPFRKRLIGGYEALSPEIWLIEIAPGER
jgi:Tol biopolymer transport system component